MKSEKVPNLFNGKWHRLVIGRKNGKTLVYVDGEKQEKDIDQIVDKVSERLNVVYMGDGKSLKEVIRNSDPMGFRCSYKHNKDSSMFDDITAKTSSGTFMWST